jgi:hypothetical protein
MKNKKNKLVQISLNPKAFGQLMELKNLSRLNTITEVVKYSISVYKWIIEKQQKGYEIYAIPNEGKDVRKRQKIEMILPI